jgi:hypothetical protein
LGHTPKTGLKKHYKRMGKDNENPKTKPLKPKDKKIMM